MIVLPEGPVPLALQRVGPHPPCGYGPERVEGVSRGWVLLLSDMLLAEGLADMIMRVHMGELLGDMGWRRGQVSGGAPT